MVERHLAKVNVASSNLVFRSISEQALLVPIFLSEIRHKKRPVSVFFLLITFRFQCINFLPVADNDNGVLLSKAVV